MKWKQKQKGRHLAVCLGCPDERNRRNETESAEPMRQQARKKRFRLSEMGKEKIVEVQGENKLPNLAKYLIDGKGP